MIVLSSRLPSPSRPVDIIGDGATIDGSLTGSDCLEDAAGSDGSRFFGLEIKGCGGFALDLSSASGHQLSRLWIHDTGDGIQLGNAGNTVGPGNDIGFTRWALSITDGPNTVFENRLHDCNDAAIRFTGGADDSIVERNDIYWNSIGVYLSTGTHDVLVRHNTFHGNTNTGLWMHNNTTGTDCRNNIFTGHANDAISAKDSNFGPGLFDYNDFFANGGADCTSCTLGPNSLLLDPSYIDVASDDLRLHPATTPLIDAGVDVGVDMNGPAVPANFNGAAPEIGARETP